MPAAATPSGDRGRLSPQLVRAIGRWTLTALVVNCIIGSGIFGLPGDVARLVGRAAPWAYLIAAVGIGVIVAVHAELASQFQDAGGPYLYAREAFGRFWGIQIGWFAWLVRLTSGAANANLFVTYLGEFWGQATAPWSRAVLLTALVGGLAATNYRGVQGGVRLSNLLTVAKLVPLGAFIIAGLILARQEPAAASTAGVGVANWMSAVMVLVFAFGGFEVALIPMAEAKHPRRDAPFALFAGLAVITLVYVLAHVVCMWSLPNLPGSARPLADAARAFVGPAGAIVMAVGAMLSTFGNLSAQLVGVPRLTYALAQHGDFPRILSTVHPRFRTPHVSIVLWAVLVLGLAIYGNFIWNAILSVAGRLVIYAVACAALIQLRRKRPDADAFRLRGGNIFAVVGMAFCTALALRMTAVHAKIILTLMAVATLNWLVVRAKRHR